MITPTEILPGIGLALGLWILNDIRATLRRLEVEAMKHAIQIAELQLQNKKRRR